MKCATKIKLQKNGKTGWLNGQMDRQKSSKGINGWSDGQRLAERWTGSIFFFTHIQTLEGKSMVGNGAPAIGRNLA